MFSWFPIFIDNPFRFLYILASRWWIFPISNAILTPGDTSPAVSRVAIRNTAPSDIDGIRRRAEFTVNARAKDLGAILAGKVVGWKRGKRERAGPDISTPVYYAPSLLSSKFRAK